jgi:transcriptional repressor of cell division inhibition gene dicB
MLKADVISHFGSRGKVARALGISRQAVQAWREVVPLGRAYQVQELTKGRLKLKRYLYGKTPAF